MSHVLELGQEVAGYLNNFSPLDFVRRETVCVYIHEY